MNTLRSIISGSSIQQTNALGRGKSLAALIGAKRPPALAGWFRAVGWMSRLLAVGLLVAVSSVQANAAPTISLYDGVNPLITVVDDGPGDHLSVPGTILLQTNVGVWNTVISTVQTKPILGSATDPEMDVNIQATSVAAGSLRVVFSDNSFGPATGTLHANVTGNVITGAVSTVSYNVFGDPANVVGATTVLIASTGTRSLPTGATAYGPLALGAPFSLTQVLQLLASGATSINADASLYVGDIRLTPARATNEVNTAHTVCASVTVLSNGVSYPFVGTAVTFNVTNGPNATVHGTVVTATNGVACFTYVGTGGVGTDIIDVSFIDPNGRRHSAFATKVWVNQSCPPTILCASNKVVECGAPWDFDSPLACDGSGGSNVIVGIVSTVTNRACGDTFSATRTWAVVNGVSNTVSCSQTVTVVDTTPPQILCPAPITAEFQDENGAVVPCVIAASDTCSPVTLMVTPPCGSLFPIGVTPVQATAMDGCSNSASCTFPVTVLGAQGVKSNVLVELIVLRDQATQQQNGSDVGWWNCTIENLILSLQTSRWLDQKHVVCGKPGGEVFDQETERGRLPDQPH